MAKRTTDETKDPLGPLEFLVRNFLILIAFLWLLLIPLIVFGSGSLTTMNGNEACAYVDKNQVATPGDLTDSWAFPEEYAAKRTHIQAEAIEVCNTQAGVGLHAVAVAGVMSDFAVVLAVLITLHRLIRMARRAGLFTNSVANGTRLLGWVVILASLGAELVQQLCNTAVLRSVAIRDKPHYFDFVDGYDLPFTAIVVGVGLISLGGVLSRAVALQEEQDATI